MLLPSLIVLTSFLEGLGGQVCDKGDLRALMLKLNQLEKVGEGDAQDLYKKVKEQSLKAQTYAESLTEEIRNSNDNWNNYLDQMRKRFERRDSFKGEVNDIIAKVDEQTGRLTERFQDIVSLQISFGAFVEQMKSDVLQLKLEIAGCMDGWMVFNGSCYLFSVSNATFFQVATACTDLGAHLVYVEIKAENDFVKGVISKLKDGRFWVGVTDLDTEGTWLYYGENTRPQFYDWYQQQPDNWRGAEDCVHYWGLYDYQWNDQDCLWPTPYICEKKNGS